MQLSLFRPALDAIGSFSLLVLFLSPVWGWLTDHNHALQSIVYLCTIGGFLWRGATWLRRYLWRRRQAQVYLAAEQGRRIRKRLDDLQ